MKGGVLVTGATTPLGLALVESLRLREDVAHVLAVGREELSSSAALAPLERHGVTYVRADLTRPRHLRQLLFGPARDLDVTAIVHGAHHRSAHDTGRWVQRLNVESTRNLLHLAEDHPTIRRFVLRSYADVYRVEADLPVLVGEEHPLRLSTHMTQRTRDRIEADVTVCTRMGLSALHVVVLRLAEILCAGCGSQLHDYLSSRLCFRPLGFDPTIGVITVADAVRAIGLALDTEAQGIFNIPGHDVLPLSEIIHRVGRLGVPVPGLALTPLYRARTLTRRLDFRYDLNAPRFHFSGVLDGRRARDVLGYEPRCPVDFDAVRRTVRGER